MHATTKRNSVVRAAVLAAALVIAAVAMAQKPPKKMPRVGFCGAFHDRSHVFYKVFVEGLRKRGWVEGTNVQILVPEQVQRAAPGGLLLKSCDEYMADKDLDVIVDSARHDDPNYKVPIVVGGPFPASAQLDRVLGTPRATSPTRNITGITYEKADFRDKMLALLKEATGAENIFFLEAMPPGPNVKAGVGSAETLPAHIREAARKLGVKVIPVVFTKLEDFEPAFQIIGATPRKAAIFHHGLHWRDIRSGHIGPDWYLHKLRIPFMMPSPDWVQAMDTFPFGYGASMVEANERMSYFVDRILRGAKPADLPFEQVPLRFGINVNAAKLYGITVPSAALLQADIVVPPHPRFSWGVRRPHGPAGPEP